MVNDHKFFSYLVFIFSAIYFFSAVYYYSTGFMGTMFWVLFLLPVAYTIYTLEKLKQGELYPKLGKLQYAVGLIFIAICLFSAFYLTNNYLDLIYTRVGSFNLTDKIVGILLFLLIVEYARREHKVLFFLILILMVYCLFGDLFPGILKSSRISLERLITSSTVEIKLGMFGTYAQAGIGIIGAFLLLMGIAKGFEVDKALIRTIISAFSRRPALIPQSAVIGSMSVAMCTGSGAADSALVGQFTIPAMKRAGFPALYAAATEGSAALGGLIMPPVMAIAAFLMAEFLGVSYFQVVIRGFVLAFIYYISIILTVYLLTLQYVKGRGVKVDDVLEQLGKVKITDKIGTLIFFASLVLLIALMGYFWWPEVRAALFTSIVFLVTISILRIFSAGNVKKGLKELLSAIRGAIEGYPAVVVDILLLLAVLGIIINLFTVSGWLIKLSMLLLDVGKENLLLLIFLSFIFAYFLGFGLPPSAVYIIASVLVVSPLVAFGTDKWVAHFFVFLAATISEFTPPVALIAAVTSRIAETPFVKTAIYTQKWILPIYLLIFAVITWPELVVKPGWEMLQAFIIVLIACLTVTVGSFGKISKVKSLDYLARLTIILLGFVILYSPLKAYAPLLSLLSLFVIVFGVSRTIKVSS